MTILLILSLISSPELRIYEASYVSCYDGDTCYFNFHLGFDVILANQAVRFCDIDTLEMRGDTKEKATEIRDSVHEILVVAKDIQILVPQKSQCKPSDFGCDKRTFTRWLGYVIVDGVNLNQKMLDIGIASEYTKSKCPLDLKATPL
jgi:endonuclease YncB( thermonuclease family)